MDPTIDLISRWRGDSSGTYRSWFLWEERIKNFRSIRRGLRVVIDQIAAGQFGCAYRDSSLETVASFIAEQCQIFKGADHAFLWIAADTGHLAAAFEVEHKTSIYSGVVRMLDLALGLPEHAADCYFLTAPDGRETDIREQFARPAFSRVGDFDLRYLPYGEQRRHRESIARFGSGLKAVNVIARQLR